MGQGQARHPRHKDYHQDIGHKEPRLPCFNFTRTPAHQSLKCLSRALEMFITAILLNENSTVIKGITSKEGEEVMFVNPMSTTENPRINEWLFQVTRCVSQDRPQFEQWRRL